MRLRFLLPLLIFALSVSVRADDLGARAAQIKAQLQTSWLPAWANKLPANESAFDAARLVQTLSHAHRLGYLSADFNYLVAARAHYQLLRDSRRDKVGGGFFAAVGGNKEATKSTLLQAQVIPALVEYARASGESEPRALALSTWRLLRERARDRVNGGGYFETFLGGPLSPTQASGSGPKTAPTQLAILEAGAALYELTRDRSVKSDGLELLDLNEGRFFPPRRDEGTNPVEASLSANAVIQAGATIARAEGALGVPVGWVDFARRAQVLDSIGEGIYAGSAVDALTLLAQNVGRERRAAQIDGVLDTLGGNTPDVRSGFVLLDFVGAFGSAPT